MNMALSLEEFDLKPNCSLDKKLLIVECCRSLVILIFKNFGGGIDLQLVIICLSPFLQIGFISEYLRYSGNISENKDWLPILANGELMKGEFSFIIFTEISSHPYEVEDFKYLMTLSISYLLVQLNLICGNGCLDAFDKYVIGGILLLEFCILWFF